MSGRTAVVTGGGPVGAVAALMLAQQGWQVQVFERGESPSDKPAYTDHRSYRLNLTTRGLRVLKLANVDMNSLIATQGKFLEAAFIKPNGQPTISMRLPMTEDPLCIRAFRDEVALLVIQEAQRQYPQAIKFHFNAAVQTINLERQTVSASFAKSDGTHVVPYDLLVGADGAGSAVRAAIQQVMPAGYARRYRHKQMYSMAQVERPANPEDIPQHAVFQAHMLAAKEGLVLWDGAGSDNCRVGLALPQELAEELRHGNTDTFDAILARSCPSLPSYARKAAWELALSKPPFYTMPSWMHLSQLHGPKVVLLGDAAHTITPALGQGLNAGLEDVAVFAQILEEHQGDVDTALLAYNKARLPDVQAIMTINEVVSSADAGLACQEQDVAHRLWLLGHKVLFILHMVLRTTLHKVAPRLISGPGLIQLVTGASPYRAFISGLYRDGLCCAGILVIASALAVHMIR